MEKWEYKILYQTRQLVFLSGYTAWAPAFGANELQKMGDEGWELATCIVTQDGMKVPSSDELMWIFKRPKA